jgi:hypothetical protein
VGLINDSPMNLLVICEQRPGMAVKSQMCGFLAFESARVNDRGTFLLQISERF